jgi:hypothetical protein
MNRLIFLFFIMMANIAYSTQVLLIVDGKAITDLDVAKRIEGLRLVNPGFEANDAIKRSILAKLMNEELCNNEARRLNIKADPEEVIAQFNEMAKSSGIPQSKLDIMIKNKSLYNQVENQVLWNDLISAVLAHKIKVSDAEVREEQKVRKGTIKEVTFQTIALNSMDPLKLDELRIEASSCEALKDAAKRYSLPQPQRITFPIDDLNNDLQAIIRTIEENKLSDVVKVGGQNQLIMVCNKNIINNPKNYKQIKNELINRKINLEAQKYLAELKKRVYIEYTK